MEAFYRETGGAVVWGTLRLGMKLEKAAWQKMVSAPYRQKLTPALFQYRLIEKARKAARRIILPESTEIRTLKAARICAEQGFAQCVLIGNPAEITQVAKAHALSLPKTVEIISADQILEKNVALLVKLRAHKGMTETAARTLLQNDTVALATLLLYTGEVDGLVSGALHTTADTIRPALQIIKMQEGMRRVSSIFFMCLPEEVVVYGDCAVNPNPTAEDLADIAIQSADSAAKFGIDPHVAMISYSTKDSGTGPDVDKVKEAVRLISSRRPDLKVDGPLQYDAAVDKETGLRKAPHSLVAGSANVFIFPDLNTGNTVYKAVQRTNRINCIGPMLQGLRKPVNDLSRGCSVEDIVYTIALTAVQA
jgi:phosphate acetyltransferase